MTTDAEMNISTRKEVYQSLDKERDYQDSMRSEGRFTETVLPVSGELICMKRYLDDAFSSYTSSPGETPAETLNAIRKITAMGVRTLEHYGASPRQ
jgi:hypothetical protein